MQIVGLASAVSSSALIDFGAFSLKMPYLVATIIL